MGCQASAAEAPIAPETGREAAPQPRRPLVEPPTALRPAALQPAPAVIAIPEIDALVSRALAEHKLPGCVIAIGRKSGLLFLRAYGMRAVVPTQLPMTEDTIFDLASLTKPIATASSVLRLAEQGKLGLDDPASRYLRELDRPSTRAITVRQLLLHSAGLAIEDPIRNYARGPALAIAALLASKPIGPPDRFVYSDIGYLWLGELVQRISGQRLDAFAHDNLFAPLAMIDTQFKPNPALLPRIAPTEITDDRGAPHALIHGVVHDPRAYLLGGVAGNAGLFSTARDLARFASMLLGRGTLEGTRVLRESSVDAMTRPVTMGDSVRTLGWDVHSRYSRLRGTLLSEQAFGHGGYTGTSLWIDPGRDLFVVLLSNRVHPDPKGNVIGLAGAIADAAVRAVGRAARVQPTPRRVLPGIDVLRDNGFAEVLGKRIGLLTHMAARTADGESSLQVLARAKGVRLAAIFSPEHGLSGTQEGAISDGRDPTYGIPVYSLYGATRTPSAPMLQGLDLIVVDLVDVGVRFFTYMSTLHEMLRAAANTGVPVLVLDRPNPLGGVAVEGPVLDPGAESFVNHYALPIRHAMTAGELAVMINSEERLGLALQVIEAQGWCRDQLFTDTGLAWTNPSPNLRSPAAALLYPAVGLLEGTNLSVGRGTDRPFQHLGAPFIDGKALSAELLRARLPGVRFGSTTFVPKNDRYAHERCSGISLTPADAHAFQAVRTGLEIARALRKLYAERWDVAKLMKLLGHTQSMQALLQGQDIELIERSFQPRLGQFLERRERFLLYRRCEKH